MEKSIRSWSSDPSIGTLASAITRSRCARRLAFFSLGRSAGTSRFSSDADVAQSSRTIEPSCAVKSSSKSDALASSYRIFLRRGSEPAPRPRAPAARDASAAAVAWSN
eukprot:6561152-Prymnesium_polylepis.1